MKGLLLPWLTVLKVKYYITKINKKFREPLGAEGIVHVVSDVAASKQRHRLTVKNEQQTGYCSSFLSTRISLSCSFLSSSFFWKQQKQRNEKWVELKENWRN
jgi:hypothetical protein